MVGVPLNSLRKALKRFWKSIVIIWIVKLAFVGQNWGYCSYHCHLKDIHHNSKVMEARMDILSSKKWAFLFPTLKLYWKSDQNKSCAASFLSVLRCSSFDGMGPDGQIDFQPDKELCGGRDISEEQRCPVSMLLLFFLLLSSFLSYCYWYCCRHDICQKNYATAVLGARILRKKHMNRDITQFATKEHKCFKMA